MTLFGFYFGYTLKIKNFQLVDLFPTLGYGQSVWIELLLLSQFNCFFVIYPILLQKLHWVILSLYIKFEEDSMKTE